MSDQVLTSTLYDIEKRGWRTKSWVTRSGSTYGGNRFNRHTLAYLLSNPIYVGKVRLKGELHKGEHAPIIPTRIWCEANALLRRNPRGGISQTQPRKAILRGLLYCEAC